MDKDNEETRDNAKDILDRIHKVNLFRITTEHVLKTNRSADFKVEVVINSTLGMVIIETGAKASVCSLQQVRLTKCFHQTHN